MTSSQHLGDALSALLDGELGGLQETAARAHLVACMDCAGELHAVSQARAWVRALPPVDPPFGFYERLLLDRGWPTAPVAPTPTPALPSLRRRMGLAALGAAAAAVTVLGVGSPAQSPVTPATPRLVQARATSVSVSADLLSKLNPVPVSFGR